MRRDVKGISGKDAPICSAFAGETYPCPSWTLSLFLAMHPAI